MVICIEKGVEQANFATAKSVFEQLPARYQYPTLAPDYVVADCLDSAIHEPVFYTLIDGDNIFYYATRSVKTGSINIGLGNIHDHESQRGYGGPVCYGSDSFLHRAIASYQDQVAKNKLLVEFVRYVPLLDNHLSGFSETFQDRETVYIDLLQPNLMMDSYQTRARRAIRKAIKAGLRCRWAKTENDWRDFSTIYTDRMNSLNAHHDYFYSEDYFLALSNTSLARLLLCYEGDEKVGGVVFLNAGNYADYHLSACTDKGLSLWATPLLICEGANYYQSKRYHFLQLGGGTSSAEDDPLLYFKSGFSTLKKPFFIGKKVQEVQMYNHLINDWKADNKPVNRILFYR